MLICAVDKAISHHEVLCNPESPPAAGGCGMAGAVSCSLYLHPADKSLTP